MSEDTPETVDTPEDPMVAALLAERDAIRLHPSAERRQAEIDELLAGLGYETATPGEMEKAVPAKRTRR